MSQWVVQLDNWIYDEHRQWVAQCATPEIAQEITRLTARLEAAEAVVTAARQWATHFGAGQGDPLDAVMDENRLLAQIAAYDRAAPTEG